jgi:hypothetical protein
VVRARRWAPRIEASDHRHADSVGRMEVGHPRGLGTGDHLFESLERQGLLGDLTVVSARTYARSPRQARVPPNQVYESLGVAQIKWLPDGTVNPGTEPLRWQSTAFNLDYLGATIRYYYDGSCYWCRPGYRPGQEWLSVEAWNAPNPWVNSKGKWYISKVKYALARHTWGVPAS